MGINLPQGFWSGMLRTILSRIGVSGIMNGASSEWRYVYDIKEKEPAKLLLQEKLGLEKGIDKKIVFMLGRLVDQKGISLLIEGKERIKELLIYL